MQFQFLKDIYNNNYIGIDIKNSTIDKNGLLFSEVLQSAQELIPNFSEQHIKLLNRNKNHYHMTVFSVMEYGQNSSTDDIVGSTINDKTIVFKGIGMIEKNNMQTYFVVVEAPFINSIRETHGFKSKDLHITIAYSHKDLFHDRKNESTVYKF